MYLWHCDRDGNYSLYSEAAAGENYLRGAQEVDAGGTATFTSIFPACYSGRWPHVHFEVYGSLADATSSGPIVKTSQIALPKEACEAVYATAGYEQSVSNLSQVSLAGDMVFGDDGGIHQLATMSGDADERLRGRAHHRRMTTPAPTSRKATGRAQPVPRTRARLPRMGASSA